MAKMPPKVIGKDGLLSFTANLIRAGRVIGVRRKENKFDFGLLKNAEELALDYDVTLRSPKVFFQPPSERLFDFELEPKIAFKADFATGPFVLFGVHTYDLRALNQMDSIWADGNADEHYFARRNTATIIAIEPARASKWSFWSSMESSIVDKGFDLLLADIGDKYVVEIGTKKGEKLLSRHARDAKAASSEDIKAREYARMKLAKMCSPERAVKLKAGEITSLIKSSYKHPVWERQAEKCFSCGSCNLVCPTCYCFDVKDNIELDLKHGSRKRLWDGCLFKDFAAIGSGENFREHRAGRFRHRIFRKMVYVPEKIGELACVGCGRCSEACLPDIADPVQVINKIVEGEYGNLHK